MVLSMNCLNRVPFTLDELVSLEFQRTIETRLGKGSSDKIKWQDDSPVRSRPFECNSSSTKTEEQGEDYRFKIHTYFLTSPSKW